MWRPTIVSIPAERHAVRIIEFYLSSLLITIIRITIVVLRNIKIGFANMLRSEAISWYFTRKYMPVGIIWISVNEAKTAYAICVLSHHSLLQSISKNVIPFACSVHMNISMSIDITGIYNTNPNPMHRRSRIWCTVSILVLSIFKRTSVNIVADKIAYAIYIYVYMISSDRSIYIIG